jgi:hypothetical protein
MSPGTRERRAEWRVGGPRARESCPAVDAARPPAGVAPDSVFFMPLGGRLWCNNVAVTGPAQRRPSRCDVARPSAPVSVADHSGGFDACMSAVRQRIPLVRFVSSVVDCE